MVLDLDLILYLVFFFSSTLQNVIIEQLTDIRMCYEKTQHVPVLNCFTTYCTADIAREAFFCILWNKGLEME